MDDGVPCSPKNLGPDQREPVMSVAIAESDDQVLF